MMSTMKGISIVVLFLLACMGEAWAGVTNCNVSPGLQTDGRPVLNDFAALNTTNFYYISVLAGHSYSVEATNNVTAYAFASNLVLSLLSAACGSTTQTFTNTMSVDPDLGGTDGARISFVAAATTNLNIGVQNPNTGTGITYTIRFRDTTMFNPRWSSFNGFITQWAFKNTTNSTINCILTANDTLGSPSLGSLTIAVNVGAGASVFKIIGPGGDINVPAQHGGDATLACGNGVPGGIKADAYFIGNGLIVPSTFEARNYQ